jgi:hypothetical protein
LPGFHRSGLSGLETGGVAELPVAQDGADPLQPLREACMWLT